MSTERDQAIALVQSVYDTFGRGDLSGLLSLLSPDIEWLYYGAEPMPWNGRFVGHAGLMEFLGRVSAGLEVIELKAEDLFVDGDAVFAFGRARARVKKSAQLADGRFAQVFFLKNQRVQRFVEYPAATIVAAVCSAYGAD